MQVVAFDTAEDIPIVDAVMKGPRDSHRVRLVFDTGCGVTQLDSDLVDSLGYSAALGEERLIIIGATGEEVEGYSLRLETVSVLGKTMRDVLIGAFDFSHYDRYQIHGLLGFDVIKRLHLEMNGPKGELKVF